MNAPISMTPASTVVTTSVLTQPTLFARTRPHVTPSAPAPARTSPTMSSCGRAPKLSLSREIASGISAMPTGTLSQKIQCQLIPLTTAPPTTGPIATPSPVMPPHSPIAAPRFSTGNASLISVRVSGMTIAAPAPCTARAPTSAAAFGETAAAADAAVNSNRPRAYMRRRPNRSPSAAPVNRKQANARL